MLLFVFVLVMFLEEHYCTAVETFLEAFHEVVGESLASACSFVDDNSDEVDHESNCTEDNTCESHALTGNILLLCDDTYNDSCDIKGNT